MAFLWEEVTDFYNRTMENADTRVADWPLMSSPLPTLFICLSYVCFVKILGPAFMKDREPFNIRGVMIFYNFAMVIVSFLLFFWLGQYGWFTKYSWKCQPIDYSNSSDALNMVSTAYWYYFSKFIEFADTIFFVLRKKYTHVSTLHVIHHGVMPMSVWFGVKFTPGGHSTFFAFINSFVHILMYFYYGVAAIGPHMYKYLWWKKYMTGIQMVQFVMIFVHSFQLLFIDCHYPRGFMWWIGFHAVMFWFLFWEFFRDSYIRQLSQRMNAAVANSKFSKKSKSANGKSAVNGNDSKNGHAHKEQNGTTMENGSTINGVSQDVGVKNGVTKRLAAKVNEK